MKPPATVFLIRHGTNPKVGKGLTGWLPGVSLDENGRRQAQSLAIGLGDVPLAAIYSSPLERTMEMATPLALRKGLDIIPEPRFGEVHFGDWQGKNYSEIENEPIWLSFNNFRSGTRAPGGELMLETQARMVAGLLDIAGKYPGENVAIFSHADAIKSSLCWMLGIPIDFHQRLEILPASVSTVVLSDLYVPLVRAVNVCYDHYR